MVDEFRLNDQRLNPCILPVYNYKPYGILVVLSRIVTDINVLYIAVY